jgi:hypothetical protein
MVVESDQEMRDEPTFVCKDCGCDVYDALGQVRERCLTCQWLADIPDPVEREKLREVLGEAK